MAGAGAAVHVRGQTRPGGALEAVVEVRDQLRALGQAAGLEHGAVELIGRLVGVCPAQSPAHGRASDPEGAALIAQQVAPAASAGLGAFDGAAPGHGAGAGDQRDALVRPGGGQQQTGVVHDAEPRCGQSLRGLDHEPPEPAGVVVGVHAARPDHHVDVLRGRIQSGGVQLLEHGGQPLPGLVAAHVLHVGAAAGGLGADDELGPRCGGGAVRAQAAGGGSADVQADHGALLHASRLASGSRHFLWGRTAL